MSTATAATMAPMTAYSRVSIPVSSEEVFDLVHLGCSLSFLKGWRSSPEIRTSLGPHDCTENAGVISGHLSERFLPITATFRVRVGYEQRLCQQSEHATSGIFGARTSQTSNALASLNRS